MNSTSENVKLFRAISGNFREIRKDATRDAAFAQRFISGGPF